MRRTKAEAAETREQILAAAEEVFLRLGVNYATLDQIATEAGVTRGAIYWHFKDKYELFEALYEAAKLPQEQIAMRALEETDADPLAIIETCIVDSIRTIAADPRRQRACTIMMSRCEYVGPLAKLLVRFRESSEQMHRMFLRAFQMARKQKKLDARWSPAVAARVLSCTTIGIFSEWLGWDVPSGTPKDYEAMVRNLFATFRAD